MTDAADSLPVPTVGRTQAVYSKGTNAGGRPHRAPTPANAAPGVPLRSCARAGPRHGAVLALLAVVCAVGLYSIEATHFHHTLAEQLQCPAGHAASVTVLLMSLRRSLHPTSASRGGARRSIPRGVAGSIRKPPHPSPEVTLSLPGSSWYLLRSPDPRPAERRWRAVADRNNPFHGRRRYETQAGAMGHGDGLGHFALLWVVPTRVLLLASRSRWRARHNRKQFDPRPRWTSWRTEPEQLAERYKTVLAKLDKPARLRRPGGQAAAVPAPNRPCSLEKQLADIDVTERQILPFIRRMLSTLDEFVKLDIPFLADERGRRLPQLNAMMDDARSPSLKSTGASWRPIRAKRTTAAI